jgi:Ran-binding protein 1
VFGSATTFGAGSGFAGFTGVSSSTPAAAAANEDDGGEEDGAAGEEECQAEFKPIVQLEEVETLTGEEDEAALVDL